MGEDDEPPKPRRDRSGDEEDQDTEWIVEAVPEEDEDPFEVADEPERGIRVEAEPAPEEDEPIRVEAQRVIFEPVDEPEPRGPPVELEEIPDEEPEPEEPVGPPVELEETPDEAPETKALPVDVEPVEGALPRPVPDEPAGRTGLADPTDNAEPGAATPGPVRDREGLLRAAAVVLGVGILVVLGAILTLLLSGPAGPGAVGAPATLHNGCASPVQVHLVVEDATVLAGRTVAPGATVEAGGIGVAERSTAFVQAWTTSAEPACADPDGFTGAIDVGQGLRVDVTEAGQVEVRAR